MVTFLDIGLTQALVAIFPFLLILVFSFAVLNRFAVFKDKPALTAIISFVLAVLTLLSPIVTKTIVLMSPFIVLMIMLGLFVFLAYQAFGIEEKTIVGVITGEEYGPIVGYLIVFVLLAIVIGSLSAVVSEERGFLTLRGEPETGEVKGFVQVITHPKVLGLLLIFLVGVFTVNQLTKSGIE